MVNSRPPDEDLEQRSRELFEHSVGRLDARTRSRLNQARQKALTELNRSSTRRYWLAAPLGGLAAAALVAVLLMSGRESAAPQLEAATLPLDDFDIVADDDSFEMIQDVEFYSWLADNGATAADSSG